MEKIKEKINKEENKTGPTVVIRISGMIKVKSGVANTLDRMKLRRKYACILIDNEKKELRGMLKKVKYFVAFGPIDKKTLAKLIKEKGKSVQGDKKELKIDDKKVASDLMAGGKLIDFGLKPFFRLHPPRKGIKSKLQFPKGVLGNNGQKINELIERML